MLISFSLASRASATSSKIFFLSCEDKAYRTSFYQVIVLLRQKEGTPVCYFHLWIKNVYKSINILNCYQCHHTWSLLELSFAATAISRPPTSLSRAHKCASWWKRVPTRSPWRTLIMFSGAYPLQKRKGNNFTLGGKKTSSNQYHVEEAQTLDSER